MEEIALAGASAPAPATPPSASTQPVPTSVKLPPTRSFEPLEKVIRTISRGQTLGRILRRLGVTGKEAQAWFDAIDEQYPITRLKPGQRLHLYFERTPTRHRKNNLKAVRVRGPQGTEADLGEGRQEDPLRKRCGAGDVAGPPAPWRVSPSNRTPSNKQTSFLSEYALARIKQRNGLLEYTPPSNGTANGVRPVPPLENAERIRHRLKSGEHLWGVLRKYELDDGERRLWLAALKRQKHVRRLHTGSRINFYFKDTRERQRRDRLQRDREPPGP